MQNSHRISSKLIPLIIITAFSLSACGIKAPLKTPPPLWGKEKPADAQPISDEQKEVDTPSEASPSKS